MGEAREKIGDLNVEIENGDFRSSILDLRSFNGLFRI
jgi:hypothetical protein